MTKKTVLGGETIGNHGFQRSLIKPNRLLNERIVY